SSGIAALGLELIWVRILGLALGSERLGMLAVLAAFFSGVALGSAALHGLIIRSRHPAKIYIVAECTIAAYALVASSLLLRVGVVLPRLLEPVVGDNRSFV